jgi:Protein of unknown function (DUF2924)
VGGGHNPTLKVSNGVMRLAFRAPASAHGTVVYSRRKVRTNMDMALVGRMEELRRLSVPALKGKYREIFGEETRSSHKQYLFRRIAWQLQAQQEGGLSERAVARAVQIADDADLRSSGPKGFWSWPEQVQKIEPGPRSRIHRDGRLPQAGTLLTRRHKGREVVVKVLDVGFEYQSRHYGSLSAIALVVTGNRWNGLLFFGLTERRRG